MPDETTGTAAAAPATATITETAAIAPAAAVTAAGAADKPVELESLIDFCARASRTDRRVELLAAFYHEMTVQKKKADTLANWQAALAAFANQPA